MSGFLTEAPPPAGLVTRIGPGIRRLVASNPGPMTYHGTNTYLVDAADGMVVIDPGPDDEAHVGAILAAGRPALILLTHTHRDHVGAVPRLLARADAPVAGYARPAAPVPLDRFLADDETIAGLTALHTPGHASDHLCYALPDGTVFTGDHVMSWSTSVVAPPDGDMAAYMRGLRRLLARDDRRYLPGHGPPIEMPAAFTRALLAHRAGRERAVREALGTTPRDEAALVARVYRGTDAALMPVAARNLAAHLAKLAAEGHARQMAEGWVAVEGSDDAPGD